MRQTRRPPPSGSRHRPFAAQHFPAMVTPDNPARCKKRGKSGQTMARPIFLTCALALAACSQVSVAPPTSTNLAAEVVRLDKPGPPPSRNGECWISDTTPAVIETTSEQQLVTPEKRDADGTVIAAATYRSNTQTRMLRDRQEVWFRSPCPDLVTPDFIASLQRALKARGLYMAPITGEMDATTREALRRYQADRGLDSPELSLGAARELGLLPADPKSL